MSEVAMTVSVGRSNRNSGDLANVDVLGVLHVGGSGMWRFTKFSHDTNPPIVTQVVMLDSQRIFMEEIRAGAALALGLGNAQEIIESIAGKEWAQKRLELTDEQLQKLGEQSRNQGVAMLITNMDESLMAELTSHVADEGWSTHLATVTLNHVETQWDAQ